MLKPEPIAAALSSVPAWQLEGQGLVRTWQFKDFATAMSFVNQVARLAEAADHHPDIDIRWNRVKLRLTTHEAGGLTEQDWALARAVDGI